MILSGFIASYSGQLELNLYIIFFYANVENYNHNRKFFYSSPSGWRTCTSSLPTALPWAICVTAFQADIPQAYCRGLDNKFLCFCELLLRTFL